MRSLVLWTFSIFLLCTSAALADPPSWAPAHGYRNKHDKYDRDEYPHYERAYKHKHKHKYDDDHVRRVSYPVRSFPLYDAHPHVEVACDNNQSILGMIVGGAAGGLLGNQFGKGSGNTVATVGGTILGAVVGGNVGSSMENCAAQAMETARTNTQVVWRNPDSDASYVVMPTQTYQKNGMYCREYQSRVNVGSRVQEGYGTACRQPDGSWQIMN